MEQGASFGAMFLVMGSNPNACDRVTQESVGGIRVGSFTPGPDEDIVAQSISHGWSLIMKRGGSVQGSSRSWEDTRDLVLKTLSARP